jgi:hypothetical protein
VWPAAGLVEFAFNRKVRVIDINPEIDAVPANIEIKSTTCQVVPRLLAL